MLLAMAATTSDSLHSTIKNSGINIRKYSKAQKILLYNSNFAINIC